MSIPDRRPEIRRLAWLSPDLTWREKAYLVRVAELPAELDPDSGKRRHGSKAMGHDGKFALHLDYIARMLGTTPDVVKKTQEACKQKGYLGGVYPARYGRPSTLHAFLVRRDKNNGLTIRQNVPPYGEADPTTRGDETSLLTYRGGTNPDPRPGRRLSRPDEVDVQNQKRTEEKRLA